MRREPLCFRDEFLERHVEAFARTYGETEANVLVCALNIAYHIGGREEIAQRAGIAVKLEVLK